MGHTASQRRTTTKQDHVYYCKPNPALSVRYNTRPLTCRISLSLWPLPTSPDAPCPSSHHNILCLLSCNRTLDVVDLPRFTPPAAPPGPPLYFDFSRIAPKLPNPRRASADLLALTTSPMTRIPMQIPPPFGTPMPTSMKRWR